MNDYPTPEELKRIEKWCDYNTFFQLMDFIKSIWWMSDWGWKQKTKTFWISTGGWSGNEEIIEAMRKNWLFWSLCWIHSKRGGHYKFHIPRIIDIERKDK